MLPKVDALANIPKELGEKKMTQAKPAIQMFIDQLVKEADTDGDGKLSLAENIQLQDGCGENASGHSEDCGQSKSRRSKKQANEGVLIAKCHHIRREIKGYR
jgi:hypothetical protein